MIGIQNINDKINLFKSKFICKLVQIKNYKSMEKLNLNSILPFGGSYYYEDGINSLDEFESDLKDELDETIFFAGGRQGVSKTGIFIYQRDKKPQVPLYKLFSINLN